jgi:hypothetical protein
VWKWKFKGYEMVYYRVTRWGTKLWCLLTSYIEKYKVWQSKGKAKAKQGKAGQSKAKQRQSKGKAKAKQGEARRSKGEAKHMLSGHHRGVSSRCKSCRGFLRGKSAR